MPFNRLWNICHISLNFLLPWYIGSPFILGLRWNSPLEKCASLGSCVIRILYWSETGVRDLTVKGVNLTKYINKASQSPSWVVLSYLLWCRLLWLDQNSLLVWPLHSLRNWRYFPVSVLPLAFFGRAASASWGPIISWAWRVPHELGECLGIDWMPNLSYSFSALLVTITC